MNYVNTFIAVAADSKAQAGTVPPAREGKKTIAQLEYELIAAKPYQLTQEEVQFSVHVQRAGLSAREVKAKRSALWREFFSKPMACFNNNGIMIQFIAKISTRITQTFPINHRYVFRSKNMRLH